MTLAYLATPYTKVDGGLDFAFRVASRLAAQLLQSGIFAYSPIAHSHPIAVHGGLDPLDLSLWYPHNALMMDKCESLIVAHLEGWEDSAGIKYEVEFFSQRHRPIFDLDPRSLKMVKRTKVTA